MCFGIVDLEMRVIVEMILTWRGVSLVSDVTRFDVFGWAHIGHLLGPILAPTGACGCSLWSLGAQQWKRYEKGYICSPFWEPGGSQLELCGWLLERFGGCFCQRIPRHVLGSIFGCIWGWIMCDFYVTVIKISMLAKRASGRLFS